MPHWAPDVEGSETRTLTATHAREVRTHVLRDDYDVGRARGNAARACSRAEVPWSLPLFDAPHVFNPWSVRDVGEHAGAA
jgi:hypothetical protein